MKYAALIVLLLAGISAVKAQTWERTLGWEGEDMASKLIRTEDNGILVALTTSENPGSDNGQSLLKFSSSGDLIWSKTYNGSLANQAYDVVELPSGKLVMAGEMRTTSHWGNLICMNGTGDSLWTTKGLIKSKFFDVLFHDGELHASGVFIGGAGTSAYPQLVRLDTLGNILSCRRWIMTGMVDGLPRLGEIKQSLVDSRGRMVSCGTMYSSADSDVLFAISQGDSIILKSVGYGTSTMNEYGQSLIETSDGGYLLVGYAQAGPDYPDAFLIRLDSAANVQWSNRYKTIYRDIAHAAVELPDKGFRVACTWGKESSETSAGVFRVSKTGHPVNAHTFGGNHSGSFQSLIPYIDHTYLAAGYLQDGGLSSREGFLVRMDSAAGGDCSKMEMALVLTYWPVLTTKVNCLIETMPTVRLFAPLDLRSGVTVLDPCPVGTDPPAGQGPMLWSTQLGNSCVKIGSTLPIQSLQILDATGRLVLDLHPNQNLVEFPSWEMPSGLYIIRVECSDHSMSQIKTWFFGG